MELPRDMRLKLMKYRGVRGVVIYRDLQTGKKRILPKAFFLALKELKPERYELVAEAPTVEELLEKHGEDLEVAVMDEVDEPAELVPQLEARRRELLRQVEELIREIREARR